MHVHNIVYALEKFMMLENEPVAKLDFRKWTHILLILISIFVFENVDIIGFLAVEFPINKRLFRLFVLVQENSNEMFTNNSVFGIDFEKSSKMNFHVFKTM